MGNCYEDHCATEAVGEDPKLTNCKGKNNKMSMYLLKKVILEKTWYTVCKRSENSLHIISTLCAQIKMIFLGKKIFIPGKYYQSNHAVAR